MKKDRRRCWVVAGCLLVGMASVYAQGRSPKRGVCWDEKTQRLSDATVDKMLPGISWIYTWGESPQGHAAHLGDDEGIVFAPMAWGRNFNEPAIRDYVREHRAVKYLLGFNEPNFAAYKADITLGAGKNTLKIANLSKDPVLVNSWRYDSSAGIDDIAAPSESGPFTIYTLQGIRLGTCRSVSDLGIGKGSYILIAPDGTSRKVII